MIRWLYIYPRYHKVPSDQLTVLGRSPPAGTELTSGFDTGFSVHVEYGLASRQAGELSLDVLNSQLEFVAGTGPVPITASSSLQTRTLTLPPIRIPEEMTNAILSVQLAAGGETLIDRMLSAYPVVDGNHLAVFNPSPPSGTSLFHGSQVAFGTEVDYRLVTRENGELHLDVLDQNGNWLAGTGPRLISRSEASQRMALSMSAITIPEETTSLSLRVQMIGGETVLKEGLQTVPYPVGKSRSAEVLEVTGEVELILPNGTIIRLTSPGAILEPGARIVTGLESEVVLIADDSRLTIKELTDIRVDDLSEGPDSIRTRLWLKAGEVAAEVNLREATRSDFAVRTPTAQCGVRGTVFGLRVDENPELRTTISVTDGSVEVTPENALFGPFILGPGQIATVTLDDATIQSSQPWAVSLSSLAGRAGDSVTITGADLADAVYVRFGTTAAAFVQVNATQVIATVPQGVQPGETGVTVSTTAGTSSPAAFTVTLEAEPDWTNLSLEPGVEAASSSTFSGWPEDRIRDDNLNTSWFAASGDAANRGSNPWAEVVFPFNATVKEIGLRGNREYAESYDIFAGHIELFDRDDELLLSRQVELPGPDRDLDVPLDGIFADVRRVRFTSTNDEGTGPGFSELIVLGIAQIQPAGLVIVRSEVGVTISWPAELDAYILESAPGLTPPVQWTTVSAVPEVVADRQMVSVPVEGKARFFRLRVAE